ncbi:hypothetical protein Tco_0964750 [Tanacetum coccineum]
MVSFRSSTLVEVKIAQESSSKRADTELEQESIKKQKVDEDKETVELQRLIEVVPDKKEVAIDDIPWATKPPSIFDYKIYKEGKKTYYQIIRAGGSLKMYLVFSHMLKSFDREDLETLWKLVKAKHGSTRPEEGYERVLWGDLKIMFDPHVKDQVWRNQQDYKVLDWKLYDSCGLSMKKLEILKENIKFRGGLLGLKDFLMILELLLLSSDIIEESANETNDANEFDMDLFDDNPNGDDDDVRYGVFMHNNSIATPNSTHLSPTVTSSSLDFIQTLLDETPANELTDFISASEVPLGTHVDVLETKKLLQEMFPDKNTHYLSSLPTKKLPYNATTPQPSLLQAKSKKLMQKLKKNMRKINFKKASNKTHTTHQQLYDTFYESIILDQDALDAQATQSSFHKRSHDNQDPPNNREGENKKKRRKDVGEPSSRSSRRNRSPMIIVQDDTPSMQPLDKADTLIQKHSNPEWFPKKSGLDKRRTTWFDLFLKSDIDKDENHILRPSTVAIVKKFKELIQKDELTIADLEGAGLEWLKVQYNNDVELEYHVSQLKATVLSKA